METMRIKITVLSGIFLAFALKTWCQLGVNTDGTLPDNSAMLDVKSTVKGLLPPRMTQAERNLITLPAKGLTVFQTDGIPGLYYNAGTPVGPLWFLVGNNAGQWQNNGSDIYYSLGNVGIGTSSPVAHLSVAENGPAYTASFGTPISPWSSGTNVGVGNDNEDAVLYVGQAPTREGFLIWQYNANPADAYYSVGTFNGSNNMTLQEYGGKVGVRTNTPAALFHVAEESPGYTGLFGTDIGSWNSSTNVNIGDNDGPSVLYIGQNASNKGFLYWSHDATPSNAYYHIGTYGGSNPLVLQASGAASGKVGVGTTAPAARFHVAENPSGCTALFGSDVSNLTAGTNVTIGDDNWPSVFHIGQSTTNKGYLMWHQNTPPSDAFFTVGCYGGNNPLVLQFAGGNVGIGTTQPASLMEIQYNVDNSTQLGYSTVNTNYIFHNEVSANGDGQSALYAFRTSAGNNGTGYDIGASNSALKGYSYWGDLYSFGTSGFNYNDFTRCGGVMGSDASGTYWGALGYKSSGSVTYGGYFTSSGSGSGKSPQANTGIGIGAWGDLMGADIHGQVYGIYAEGNDYALFTNGPVYKNNLDVHLQENGGGTSTVLYTSVSTDVSVQTSGVASLSGGRADIAFDPAFAAAVSSGSPVIVTVTPTGNSNGVYLSEVSKSGFTVVENNDGKSNVTVNYIAIGKRAGYENPRLPAEVTDAGYTRKLAEGLHNDSDTKTNGKGFYYESGKLLSGIHPSLIPSVKKPPKEAFIPKPGPPPKRNTSDRSGCTGPGDNLPAGKPTPVSTPAVKGPDGGPLSIPPIVPSKPATRNSSKSEAGRGGEDSE